jgi:hypothetical protein
MTNGTIAAAYSASATAADASLGVPSGATRVANGIHRVLNHLILVGVPLQFYAAGLAVFGASSFRMHSVIGQAMVPLSLLSLISAILGRRAGARPSLAALLLVLVALQPVLAFAPRASFPAISAVHPVVGLLIGIVAWRVTHSAKR